MKEDRKNRPKKTIDNSIKRLRLLKGITQVELAEGAGMSQSTIQKLENSELKLKMEQAIPIASFLGTDVNNLCGLKVNKIKEARAAKGIKQEQLAAAIGMSQPNLSKIENGEQPLTVDVLQQIAAELNVEISELTTEQEDVKISGLLKHKKVLNENYAELDILDTSTSCSISTEYLSQNVIGKYLITMENFKDITNAEPENIKILSIKGNSMQPTIDNNDHVWVDTSIKKPTGDGLYLLCIKNDLYVKRIHFDFIKKRAMILSDNRSYPPLETDDPDNLKVLGKVISIHKMLV